MIRVLGAIVFVSVLHFVVLLILVAARDLLPAWLAGPIESYMAFLFRHFP
jgi:hypothetical protein